MTTATRTARLDLGRATAGIYALQGTLDRQEPLAVTWQATAAELANLQTDRTELDRAEAALSSEGTATGNLTSCLTGVVEALDRLSLQDAAGAATTLGSAWPSCQKAQQANG